MHDFQHFRAVQRSRVYAEASEIVDNINLNTFQTGFRQTKAVRVYAIGQIFRLCQAVLSLGYLVAEHLRVFRPDAVKAVSVERNVNALRNVFLRRGEVHKRELKLNGSVKEIEKLAPPIKDGGLILILTELIVCILKLDGFHIMRICYAANPIRPNALIGDAVLCGFLFLIRPIRLCDGGFDLLFLRA